MTAKVIGVIGVPLFAAFLYFQVIDFKRSYDSGSWPAVEGTVITSELEKMGSGSDEGTLAKVKYRYTVEGQTHENDKVAFGLFRGMVTWGHAAKVITSYPAGKTVKVFFNPKAPDVSCLETGGIGWEDIFMLVVGAYGVFWGTKNLYSFYRWLSHRIVTPNKKRAINAVRTMGFIFLAVVAAAGLFASVACHLMSWLLIEPPWGQSVFLLHIGIFIVWIPLVIFANRTMPKRGRGNLEHLFAVLPRWVRVATSALFAYALLNFGYFAYCTRVYPKHGVPFLLELRRFSGHWMMFYGVALAGLVGLARVSRKRRENAGVA